MSLARSDHEALRTYIRDLPVGSAPALLPETATAINTLDLEHLPSGLVTGANLIQFPSTASPSLKSAVALSLLAAQRVASNDPVVLTPDQWIERHNTVLQNLGWRVTAGGTTKSKFESFDVAVHKAIIPFLTAALGPAAAAGSLIVTALQQLESMDKEAPWITLFERQSRRFDINEFQFSVVEVKDDTVYLRLVAARLSAAFGRTQVLFFKVKESSAEFEQANQAFATDAAALEELNLELKAKLMALTKSFIRSLPDELLLGAGT
jgi:hypothetical protein